MSRHPKVTVDESIMEQMRAICLALPGAEELEAYGAPTFKVNRKHFAMLNQHEGRLTVWCKSVDDLQQTLLAASPERYFPPPYLGTRGWIGAWLDEQADPDWDEIGEIITTSYRQIAPPELSALLDEPSTDSEVSPELEEVEAG